MIKELERLLNKYKGKTIKITGKTIKPCYMYLPKIRNVEDKGGDSECIVGINKDGQICKQHTKDIDTIKYTYAMDKTTAVFEGLWNLLERQRLLKEDYQRRHQKMEGDIDAQLKALKECDALEGGLFEDE